MGRPICPGLVDSDNGTVVYAANLELRRPNSPGAVAEAIWRHPRGPHARRRAAAGTRLPPSHDADRHRRCPSCSATPCERRATFAPEVGLPPIFPRGVLSVRSRGCLRLHNGAGIARRYFQATGRGHRHQGAIEKAIGTDPGHRRSPRPTRHDARTRRRRAHHYLRRPVHATTCWHRCARSARPRC